MEEEASGRLVFSSLTCARGREVAFEIDAVLGSELHDLPPIHVEGKFRDRAGAPPRDD